MAVATFDVVIVGAGAAGATLAARLSEDPSRRVLLVEAGPDLPPDHDAHLLSTVSFATTGTDWGMRAAVRAGRTLDYPQGRAVGGGSTVNGALAIRGDPADFARWAAGGCPSWSWEQMLPAYRRLERDLDYGATGVHGADGPVPVVRWHDDELVEIQRGFAEACGRSGLPWVDDHNAPGTTGVGPFPMNRKDGRRMSTAITYLDAPTRARSNLTLWSGTTVTRIRTAAGRAEGVDLVRDGRPEAVAAGEVVVCAGSVQTPALLWRSGVGPADALRRLGVAAVADLRGVGANLHDHPGVFYFVGPGRRRAGAGDPQFQLGARYTSSGSADGNDMFLSMMNFWDLTGSPDFRAQLGVDAVVVLTCGVHQPRSRGSVSLTSADPEVPPSVALNLLDDPADVERLVEGVRRCAAIAADPAMADFLGPPVPAALALDDDAAMAAYVRAVVAPWYHPCGTCRMGPDPAAGAVVGDDLRVHGVDRLRVADASVLPTVPRAPTNLTVIAIGERAAEIIGT